MTTTAAERAVLVRRWERASEWPLMVAAVVFLAAYAVPILHPDLPSWLLGLCRALSWITWGLFVVDIVVRLVLADQRVRYLVISAGGRALDACEVTPDGLTFVEGADGRRRVAFTVTAITSSDLKHTLLARAERRLSRLSPGARNPCVYLTGDSSD